MFQVSQFTKHIKFAMSQCCWCLDCFLGAKRSALTDQRDARKKRPGSAAETGSVIITPNFGAANDRCGAVCFPQPFFGVMCFIIDNKKRYPALWKLPRSWKMTENEQLSQLGAVDGFLDFLHKIPPTEIGCFPLRFTSDSCSFWFLLRWRLECGLFVPGVLASYDV